MKDPRRVALAAAKALGVDAEKLYPLLADRSSHFVYVKRKADPAKAAALEKLKLPGLGFYAEELRYYPQRSVAAHVLGYAGVDNDGLEGLERSLDKALVGKPGSQTTVRDPAGRVIDVIATKPERAATTSSSRSTTGSRRTPRSVLRETVTRWGAKGGSAVVLDPRTGRRARDGRRARASTPTGSARRRPRSRRNRAVTDIYEPGSTFKVVTVAAALSEKIVSPTTPFTLPSSIRVADRIIHEHEPRPTERMTVAQILSQSSNVGTITLAQMLGRTRVESWIDRFGFGKAPASTPRRVGGDCCRATGRARRSATCRSARASASRRSRWRPRTRRSRTAASTARRISSSASANDGSDRTKGPSACSRRRSRRR